VGAEDASMPKREDRRLARMIRCYESVLGGRWELERALEAVEIGRLQV